MTREELRLALQVVSQAVVVPEPVDRLEPVALEYAKAVPVKPQAIKEVLQAVVPLLDEEKEKKPK